ncbi:HD-GYP domain-containing protein [Aureimonas jatrophae]|nr:HD-GYP domain-containing protein [Aureimonas jatrophae]MBB3952341.1 HD-GYP domain-containing protein (c-di-GMP phosphodiesterase class II) [Aureimonas jatrophae]
MSLLLSGSLANAAPALRLSQILSTLSHALDMTEGQPAGHCVRAAFVADRIGAAVGLPGPERRDLRYAVLLKDLGCSSNAARLCQLYLADDLGFKRDFKRVGSGLPEVLRFVLEQTGAGADLAGRVRAVGHILRHGGEISRELIETRCTRGASIARRLRFSETVAEGIASLDEHWDGGGKPSGLSGGAIPLFSRIALLSQIVDVFHRFGGPRAALEETRRRAGRWFDPSLVAAFQDVVRDGTLWDELAGPEELLIPLEDDPAERVDETYLDDIAQAFGDIVDAKSPYTGNHCQRVALYADMIGESLALPDEARRRLRRAALLHDIGKLGVSNSILDKPGRLDEREWSLMRRHPVQSRVILSGLPVFAEAAEIGGAHHERLDGRGYPDGVGGSEITPLTRIVTVADIFDALTADRPYRKAMSRAEAFAILDADRDTGVDREMVAALRAGVDRLERANAGVDVLAAA